MGIYEVLSLGWDLKASLEKQELVGMGRADDIILLEGRVRGES